MSIPGSPSIRQMKVKNGDFMLEQLAQECTPMQQYRELTQNAIEAIKRAGGKGDILWDLDQEMFKHEGLKKMCIIDNGDGMDAKDFDEYINGFSSSIGVQAHNANYGIGGKITAAYHNSEGVVYWGWKAGVGVGCTFLRGKTENQQTPVYGLKEMGPPEDRSFVISLREDAKPKMIDGHGTKVTLMGKTPQADTTAGPDGTYKKGEWLIKYLNSRYFRIPEGVSLKASEGWGTEYYQQRRIYGMEHYLKGATHSGMVELEGAKAHWWLLPESEITNARKRHEYRTAGHAAALYQNELYEMTALNRPSIARLIDFGIFCRHSWVFIYVEPDTVNLTSNMARTHLLMENEALPWSDWGAEFRKKMPKPLQEMLQNESGKVDEASAQSIRDHVNKFKHLFAPLTKYKLAHGPNRSDLEEILVGVPTPPKKKTTELQPTLFDVEEEVGEEEEVEEKITTKRGERKLHLGKGGIAEKHLLRFKKRNGVQSRRHTMENAPDVVWTCAKKRFDTDQVRSQGDMEDKAARYVAVDNKIYANGDYRGFSDMVKAVLKARKLKGEVQEAYAWERVRLWYGKVLVETVLVIEAMANVHWDTKDIKGALSEEGLSAAVAQKSIVYQQVYRDMGTKFGKASGEVQIEDEMIEIP